MRKKQEKYYCLRLKRGMRGGKIILKQVKNERKYLEKQLKNVRKEMDVLPGGKLRCTSSNGSDQYFIDGRYISKKKKDYAQKVAQQEYDAKLIRALEGVISKWKEIEFIYDNRILEKQFDEMCGARKRLVKPWIEPIDMKIKSFMEKEYESGTFQEDDMTEFFTLKNERVRSKSELIIADELYRYGVPYRYEMPIVLDNWGSSVTFRPDFTVMNIRNGKIFILEHLGMMDDMEYIEKNMRKLDIYERNGYLLGEKLLLTHETSKAPLSRSILDSYIESYLL